jgi:hypothetical protein
MEYIVRLDVIIESDSKQFAANEVLDMIQNGNSYLNIFKVSELNNPDDKFETITATE